MWSEMAVDDGGTMFADVCGVQVFRRQERQPDDRGREQTADDRLASTRQPHRAIMAARRGWVKWNDRDRRDGGSWNVALLSRRLAVAH
jgi:hypothetical protein